MKVIIVTDYAFVNGGAGKVALESARALADVVDEVHVFAAVGEPDSFLTGVPNLNVTSLGQKKVTDLPMREGIIGGLWNREAENKFSALLDQYDPADTVVHIHSWRDALTLSFAPEMVRRGYKFVITGHDYGLACPIAGFFNHVTQQVCPHQGLSLGCLATSCTGGSFVKKNWFVLRHALQPYRSRIPQKMRHFIALGELNEQILRPYLVPGTKVHRLANPIPVEKQPRTSAEQNEGLIFVGRFSAEKAPHHAAAAAKLAGVKISFVGSGPEESKIREANPDAEILGWKSPFETHALMSKARALVFPSIWYEGQPLVIDEAAALGLPVICSDASAGANAVESRSAGFIYKAGNIEGLAQAMQFFKESEFVKHHSEQSYAHYWANPQTPERHIRELLAIYSEVLSD